MHAFKAQHDLSSLSGVFVYVHSLRVYPQWPPLGPNYSANRLTNQNAAFLDTKNHIATDFQ